MSYDVVIPTAGRESLGRLLRALAARAGPPPQRVVVVDDRPAGAEPLRLPGVELPLQLLRGGGRGPAAARNRGWRASSAEWVAFLDDDVVTPSDWREALSRDTGTLETDVAATQGSVVVPLPGWRRPTDWERNVAGLEHACWATADIAYRRSALEATGGFDERFTRAYREDADLGLRVSAAGLSIARGERHVLHPVRPAPAGISVQLQAGNADDVLMDAIHGRGWRVRAGAPPGRLRRHLAVTGAALLAGGSLSARRRRVAACAAALWLAGTAELAWARIAPGPRTRDEVWKMLWTSALLPPAAAYHRARGHIRLHRAGPPARPAAVLLDRDGTLVDDVPYNGDPERVRPRPGASEALERLRSAGVRMAVVSNQSGIGRGLLTPEQVDAVNRRVEQLLGPIGPWFVCPHDPDDRCDCRKPRPGLVLRAAERLGVEPAACALIGDIGSDIDAARAAGARGLLVPTPATLKREVDAAPETASSLTEAVERLLA